jgi:hypothetical protein
MNLPLAKDLFMMVIIHNTRKKWKFGWLKTMQLEGQACEDGLVRMSRPWAAMAPAERVLELAAHEAAHCILFEAKNAKENHGRLWFKTYQKVCREIGILPDSWDVAANRDNKRKRVGH